MHFDSRGRGAPYGETYFTLHTLDVKWKSDCGINRAAESGKASNVQYCSAVETAAGTVADTPTTLQLSTTAGEG